MAWLWSKMKTYIIVGLSAAVALIGVLARRSGVQSEKARQAQRDLAAEKARGDFYRDMQDVPPPARSKEDLIDRIRNGGL